MSAERRFFATASETPIFIFTIDTTKTVTGATNGSENNLTFRVPLASTNPQNFILRVSDGRPDVNYTSGGILLTFATPGIYTISLIGKVLYFNPNQGYDKLKLIEINRWGKVQFGIGSTDWGSAFKDCTNLTIKAKNGLNFPRISRFFFENIKGFEPSVDLTKYDVSNTEIINDMFKGITMPFYSVVNPFINVATSLKGFYNENDMSNVPKIEIISSTVTTLTAFLMNSGFQGELIIKAPLVQIYGIMEGVVNPPSFGKVDIRYITKNGNWQKWITKRMSQENVDSTLLGWVNNFDWTDIPVRTTSVAFYGTYSNKASVKNAKLFLEAKGFTFSSLTMSTEEEVTEPEESDLPSYALSLIEDAVTNMETINPDGTLPCFLFLSDSHNSNNPTNTYTAGNNLVSERTAVELSKRINYDFFVHGGDVHDANKCNKVQALSRISTIKTILDDIPCDKYYVRGNHDVNARAEVNPELNRIESEEFYDIYNSSSVKTVNPLDLKGSYFYRDFETHNLRIHLMNNCNSPTAEFGGDGTTKQKDFFENETLNTTKELILFTHSYGTGEGYRGNLRDYETAGGRVVQVFAGHLHQDNHIISPYNYEATRVQASLNKVVNAGTADEICFNSVVIDNVNKKVYIHRVGRGVSQEYDY